MSLDPLSAILQDFLLIGFLILAISVADQC